MDPIANQLNIDTPELVSIEMPIAGIGSRFIAILLDYLILTLGGVVFGLILIVVVTAVHAFATWSENWVIGFIVIVVFLVNWGYFALFEALWNGKTPGKRAAKIRVIHRSGRAMSFLEALARNLVRYVDFLPSFYAVGVVAIFLSKQNQRLGDMVAGTLVVHDREIDTPHWSEMGSRIYREMDTPQWGEIGNRTITAGTFAPPAPANSPMAPPHLSVVLSTPALAKLKASDLQVLEGFFARRLDMELAVRAVLAQRIAAALCAKSGLEIPPGTSVETFLEAVSHQLREVARMR
jgi:uncharacterized RDD family membrane protein YckC